MKTHLTPREAVETILAHVAEQPVECIPLPEALGRVLAQEITSPLDLPPWNNAAMDGYAVRSADLGAHRGGAEEIVLQIVEEIPAGGFPGKTLGPGQCARIFTGAPVPDGADTVIRQEDTTRQDTDHVRIDDARDRRANIRPAGEDIRRGECVFTPGTELTAARLGVLASMGFNEVYVRRRPRVGFLTSGDELVDVDRPELIRSGRKIASSNTYTMLSLIQQAGAQAVNLGIARDDPDDLRRRFAQLTVVDMLVTSAGMSVGEHDYLREILEERGVDMKFWRVRMRPGAPVGFGLVRGLPWIGLPGNPVSSMVTFELFVRPAIRKMLGHARLFRRPRGVRFGDEVSLKPGLQHFLRVTVGGNDTDLVARLTGPQGSGLLSSMARANALMIVPETKTSVVAGDVLPAMLLDEPRHVEEPPY